MTTTEVVSVPTPGSAIFHVEDVVLIAMVKAALSATTHKFPASAKYPVPYSDCQDSRLNSFFLGLASYIADTSVLLTI